MARAYESKLKALDKRIAAIERAQLKRVYEPIAREFGMDPDELLDECERFLAMPLTAQLAEVDRIFDADPDADMAEREAIKATLKDPTAAHAAKIHVYRPAPGPPDVTTVLQRVWETTPAPEKAAVSDRTPRRQPEPAPEPEPPGRVVDEDEDDDAEVDDELLDLLAQVQRRLGR